MDRDNIKVIKALNTSGYAESVKPLGVGGLNGRAITSTSAWVESVIAPVDILEQKVVEPTGLLQSLEYTDPEGRFPRPTECTCESPVIESGIRITNGGLEHVDLCNTCELEVVGHE